MTTRNSIMSAVIRSAKEIQKGLSPSALAPFLTTMRLSMLLSRHFGQSYGQFLDNATNALGPLAKMGVCLFDGVGNLAGELGTEIGKCRRESSVDLLKIVLTLSLGNS